MHIVQFRIQNSELVLCMEDCTCIVETLAVKDVCTNRLGTLAVGDVCTYQLETLAVRDVRRGGSFALVPHATDAKLKLRCACLSLSTGVLQARAYGQSRTRSLEGETGMGLQ